MEKYIDQDIGVNSGNKKRVKKQYNKSFSSISSIDSPFFIPIHLNTNRASSNFLFAIKNLGDSGIPKRKMMPEIAKRMFGIYKTFQFLSMYLK